MAGRKEYIVLHPNGVDHVRVLKGGKVPAYGTWFFDHETGQWEHAGWSFQANAQDANKKALPDMRKGGYKVMATRALPASL